MAKRRKPAMALAQSQALLSHLVTTSPDVITITELATGRYALVNPAFEQVFGYPSDEVLGRTALEIGIWAHPSDRQRLVEVLRQQQTAQNLPATFRAKDGQLLVMLMSTSRFHLEGREYLVITARDITAAEQTRLEYQSILDNAMIGIAVTRQARFTLANPRFEQMLGWPSGALIGQHGSVVWSSLEEHREVGRTYGLQLGAGECVELERQLVRRDGSVFLCRILGKAVDPSHPVQSGTIWLAEDVTEQRQVQQALASARDSAEAANRAKSAFLANTSHELRTPLNALLGLARLARQPELDEARRSSYIAQIGQSAEMLSTIFSDMLDLARIEAGKLHLEQRPFRLDELLASMEQAYGALADAQGLTLRLSCEPELPEVVIGDEMRLRQILSNYLHNALKFTQVGQINLVVRRLSPETLRFEVHDTGPGIPLPSQALLFKPFAQVDTAANRSVGGTGLGLSICRQLAELMGGLVGLASTPGQGSCFWAELPLPPGSDEEMEASTGSGELDPLQGAQVLLVEDNPVNMMISVAMLEQWGVDVVQAQSGMEAISAVAQAFAAGRPFDAVLMDVQMPGISGHEATRRLRQSYTARELPIIALTAAALVSEREQALAEGMNDFLTKPIDAARMRATLVRTLRLAREPG